jgi:hypothetical protein
LDKESTKLRNAQNLAMDNACLLCGFLIKGRLLRLLLHKLQKVKAVQMVQINLVVCGDR